MVAVSDAPVASVDRSAFSTDASSLGFLSACGFFSGSADRGYDRLPDYGSSPAAAIDDRPDINSASAAARINALAGEAIAERCCDFFVDELMVRAPHAL